MPKKLPGRRIDPKTQQKVSKQSAELMSSKKRRGLEKRLIETTLDSMYSKEEQASMKAEYSKTTQRNKERRRMRRLFLEKEIEKATVEKAISPSKKASEKRDHMIKQHVKEFQGRGEA